MSDFPRSEQLLLRGRDLVSTLGPSVEADGKELLAMCGEVFSGSVVGAGRKAELQRRVAALSELLARRDARAMPLGALGRAAMAAMAGATKDSNQLLDEFEMKLSMFGL